LPPWGKALWKLSGAILLSGKRHVKIGPKIYVRLLFRIYREEDLPHMPSRNRGRRLEPSSEHEKQTPECRVAPPGSDVAARNTSSVVSANGRGALEGFQGSMDQSRNERQKAVFLREASKIRREELSRMNEEAVQVVERCKKLCVDISKGGQQRKRAS